MIKKGLAIAAVAALFGASLWAGGGTTISDESLSLRKAPVEQEKVAPPKVEYTKAAPGTAKKFERAYTNAPPLIPHSVEGLLPITRKHNACLDCHMPDKAKAVGATPIPPSHFTKFRPATKIGKDGKVIKEGKAVANSTDVVVVKKKLNKLNPIRFNCSQCHVPQSNAKPLVDNTFKPDFKDPKLKHKSNLIQVIDEGVK